GRDVRFIASPPPSGRVEARTRASNDAVVSSTLPIIPYGGFSPIRLEGWPVGRCLPAHQQAQACSRHPLVDVWFASAFRARRSASVIPHRVGPSARSCAT